MNTQVTSAGLVWRSCWISGRAGVTSDCSMEKAATTDASTASVVRGELCLILGMQKSFRRVWVYPDLLKSRYASSIAEECLRF
ncbi:hypothetical protein GCM10009554_44980 [Kribbella koreensis]|uniref:Uncharacterized protein n=1 Tax=Kribbella koreensis TaxID=57909 RepID=A0ABN1QVA5_9ACTN